MAVIKNELSVVLLLSSPDGRIYIYRVERRRKSKFFSLAQIYEGDLKCFLNCIGVVFLLSFFCVVSS